MSDRQEDGRSSERNTVERVRDAIYDAASGPDCLGISDALAEKFARAAIAALEEAGLAVVPKEPTEAMVEAGNGCDDVGHSWGPRKTPDSCGEYIYNSGAVWSAMVQSAPKVSLTE